MINELVEKILKERESKMFGYYKAVFQERFEGGYPKEWDEGFVQKLVAALKEELKMEEYEYDICTQCGGKGSPTDCKGSSHLQYRNGYNKAVAELNEKLGKL